jgi:plastocyanin
VSIAANGTGDLTTIGATRQLTATVRDDDQNVIQGATVTWSTSDAGIVSLSGTTGASVVATAVADGDATVTARSGTVEGTIDLTVATGGGFPNTADVTATAGATFAPASVDIAAGGTVTWTFNALHNVTFAATAGAPSDIPNTSTGSVPRTFPQAGNFDYQCTIHPGMNGTVVVH